LEWSLGICHSSDAVHHHLSAVVEVMVESVTRGMDH